MKEHAKLITDTSIVVNRLVSLLEENNIPTMVKDNVESARVAGFGSSPNNVDLYVYHSDLEKAKAILSEFKKA
jgi:hypothetical protein